MPCAVTLRLDSAAAMPVEALRRALAVEAGDEAVPEHDRYPPHVTLAICPGGTAEDDLRAAVAAATRGWRALPVHLAGLGLFPGDSPVLWAAPVVTEALLARHAALHAALPAALRHPHCRPGARRVPHVTLRQGGRIPPERTIARLAPLWTGPIPGKADRVELVRFPPPAVLWSAALDDAALASP